MDISKYQAVVILDDYIGTGHQSINIWHDLEETINIDADGKIISFAVISEIISRLRYFGYSYARSVRGLSGTGWCQTK